MMQVLPPCECEGWGGEKRHVRGAGSPARVELQRKICLGLCDE
jgi:hypothetical protein